AGAHDEFAYAVLSVVFPGGVKGPVTGIQVVVSVEHHVSVVLVEQLPKGHSSRALFAKSVGRAVCGLVPVSQCARGVILREIFLQPLEFGGKPGTRVRTAARLCLALYIERDDMPRAQVIGVP